MRGSWREKQETPAPDGFSSPRPLAKWLVTLLALSVAVDLVAVFSDIAYLRLLDRATGGAEIFLEEARTAENRQGVIGIAQFALFIFTAITFVIWFRRAYRNLGALGAPWLRFKPGWAVGAWFVPLLNAIRPKEIANDIWRVSDPGAPATLEGPGLGAPVGAVVNWWWAAFLISGLLGRRSFDLLEADTVPELADATRSLLAADVAAIISGILAILVVRAVTFRQDQRHAALAHGETRAPAPRSPGIPPPPP